MASTPTLLQFEAVECGAAALGIILEYHKRIVPLTVLRRECGVSRDGSKASNVLRAARRYGLKAKGFKKGLDAVKELKAPFIAFWNFNHFLVVEGFSGDQVFLNDPAIGHRRVTLDEFDDSFTGVVLLFEADEEFKPGGKRPSTVAAIRDRLAGSGQAVLFCFLAGLMLAVPGLVVPAFMQIFLDSILGEAREEWLRPLLVAMGVAVLLQIILQELKLRFLRRLKIQLSVGMSSRFFWHLLRLPISFYTQRYAGEIATRTQLNDKLADMLSGRLAETAINIITMAMYASLMFYYDIWLTLIGLLFASINFIVLKLMSERRVEANMRLRQDYGKVAGETIAALQGMETIKASGQESAFFSRWAGFYAKASNAMQNLQLTSQQLATLPTTLTALTTAFIFLIGGIRVIEGHISIGMLVAFQALMSNFLTPVKDLVNLGTEIQEVQGDIGRIDDVLAHTADPQAAGGELDDVVDADKWPLRLEGYVEFRDVEFGYSPLEPPLITDFNLSIKPGERVALVGGSGSGKTTVANLVCGLFHPWSGDVLFDNHPRQKLPRSLLVNSFSMVSQDVFLFAGSVRDNLTLWDDTVPEPVLTAALRDASILDEVMALPGGLDAVLDEGGTNLSGGQRQRLEIARALVQSPSLLVLDEATSALDAETEQLIDERLRMRGCTCLIVAHRLSTIRDSDEIIVLKKGAVVERGTHDELWAGEGLYTQLLRASGSMVEKKAS